MSLICRLLLLAFFIYKSLARRTRYWITKNDKHLNIDLSEHFFSLGFDSDLNLQISQTEEAGEIRFASYRLIKALEKQQELLIDIDFQNETLDTIKKKNKYKIEQISDITWMENIKKKGSINSNTSSGSEDTIVVRLIFASKFSDLQSTDKEGGSIEIKQIADESLNCKVLINNDIDNRFPDNGFLFEVVHHPLNGFIKTCIKRVNISDSEFVTFYLQYKNFDRYEDGGELLGGGSPINPRNGIYLDLKKFSADMNIEELLINQPYAFTSVHLNLYDNIQDDMIYFIKNQTYIFYKHITQTGNYKIEKAEYLTLYNCRILKIRYTMRRLLIVEYLQHHIGNNTFIPMIGIVNIFMLNALIPGTYTWVVNDKRIGVNIFLPAVDKNGLHMLNTLKECIEQDIKQNTSEKMNCFFVEPIKGNLINSYFTGVNKEFLILEVKSKADERERIDFFKYQIHGNHIQSIQSRAIQIGVDETVVFRVEYNKFMVQVTKNIVDGTEIIYIGLKAHITLHKVLTISKDDILRLGELIQYIIHPIQGSLMRRGRVSFLKFQINTPVLNVEFDLTLLQEKESLMKLSTFQKGKCRFKNMIMLKSANNSRVEEEWIFCYDPSLNIGDTFQNPDFEEEKKAIELPIGYKYSMRMSLINIGSFLKTESHPDNDILLASQIQTLDLDYSVDVGDEGNHVNGVMGFMDLIEGNFMLHIIVSSESKNIIFYDNFYQKKNDSRLRGKLELQDFRTARRVYYLDNYHVIVDIEGFSYEVNPFNSSAVIGPWNGPNGNCNISLSMVLGEYGNIVLCYLEEEFYVKYVNDKYKTDTDNVIKDNKLKEILKDERILYMEGSDNQELVIFAILMNETKGMIELLVIDIEVSLHITLVVRFRKKLIGGISGGSQIESIIDLQVLDNELLVIAHFNGISHLFIYSLLDLSKSNNIRSIIEFPPNMRIVRNTKLVRGVSTSKLIGSKEQEIGYEGIEKKSYAAFMLDVNYDIINKDDRFSTTRRYLCIYNPREITFNSLSLIRLKENFDLLSFGPLLYDYWNTGSIRFVLFVKETPIDDRRSNGDSNQNKIFKVVISDQIENEIRFVYKVSETDLTTQKVTRSGKKTCRFKIVSLTEKEIYKNSPVSSTSSYNNVIFDFKRWNHPFRSINSLVRIVDSPKASIIFDDYSTTLNFSNLQKSVTRFNIEDIVEGNLVNIDYDFGSSVEKSYNLLDLYPLNGSESMLIKSESKNLNKGGNFYSIGYICSNPLNSRERLERGCLHPGHKGSEKNLDFNNTFIFVGTQNEIKYVTKNFNLVLGENNWAIEKILKDMKIWGIRSKITFYNDTFLFLGTKPSDENSTINQIVEGSYGQAVSLFLFTVPGGNLNEIEMYKSNTLEIDIDVLNCHINVKALSTGFYGVNIYLHSSHTDVYYDRYIFMFLKTKVEDQKNKGWRLLKGQKIASESIYTADIADDIFTVRGGVLYLFYDLKLLNNRDLAIIITIHSFELEYYSGEVTDDPPIISRFHLIIGEDIAENRVILEFSEGARLHSSVDELPESEKYPIILLEIPKANNYVIRIPLEMRLVIESNFTYDSIYDSKRIPMRVVEFLPLSSPLMNYEPDEQSPFGYFTGSYFFTISNYKESTILLNYRINYTLLRSFSSIPDNIFYLEGRDFPGYIYSYTLGSFQLSSRVLNFVVIPWLYGSRATLPHLLIANSQSGDTFLLPFSTSLTLSPRTTFIPSSVFSAFFRGYVGRFGRLDFRLYRGRTIDFGNIAATLAVVIGVITAVVGVFAAREIGKKNVRDKENEAEQNNAATREENWQEYEVGLEELLWEGEIDGPGRRREKNSLIKSLDQSDNVLRMDRFRMSKIDSTPSNFERAQGDVKKFK